MNDGYPQDEVKYGAEKKGAGKKQCGVSHYILKFRLVVTCMNEFLDFANVEKFVIKKKGVGEGLFFTKGRKYGQSDKSWNRRFFYCKPNTFYFHKSQTTGKEDVDKPQNGNHGIFPAFCKIDGRIDHGECNGYNESPHGPKAVLTTELAQNPDGNNEVEKKGGEHAFLWFFGSVRVHGASLLFLQCGSRRIIFLGRRVLAGIFLFVHLRLPVVLVSRYSS